MSEVSGIVVVHKPKGMTSFTAVRKVRKLLSVKKAGHIGTLDPFAEGVLPIFVGKATRMIRFMNELDKQYRCTMVFGTQTDTDDREGEVLFANPPSAEVLAGLVETDFVSVRDLFSGFRGKVEQLPPLYSALKVQGKPMYEYARAGEAVERKKRETTIYDLQIHRIWVDEVLKADFSVACSKGTYIRSICRDVGELSGYFGYAQELCRTACGDFHLGIAHDLSDIEACVNDGHPESVLLSENLALAGFDRVELSEGEAKRLCMGQRLPISDVAARLGGALSELSGREFCAFWGEEPISVFRIVDTDGVLHMDIIRVFS